MTKARKLWRLALRALRAFLAAPLAIRLLVGASVILTVWWIVNWTYQAVRKPTELFFPVSGALSKTPPETWREYERIFRAHSTAVMTPELLAALAQVEGSGNPVARTYWRWRVFLEPLQLYSAAAGAGGGDPNTRPTVLQAHARCHPAP